MAGVLTLPDVDGGFEVGLSAGTDVSLAESAKLPIMVDAEFGIALSEAACWGLHHLGDRTETEENKLFINGIIFLMTRGLIRLKSEVGANETVFDGDCKVHTGASHYSADRKAMVQGVYDKGRMQNAGIFIIASKVSWWLMNHHTGTGGPGSPVQGYLGKVLAAKGFPNPSEALIRYIHQLGHYASTRHVLFLGGVPGILPTRPAHNISTTTDPIQLGSDVHKRLESLPAGTHRLAVAYAAAYSMFKSPIGKFVPDVEDFANLPALVARVTANRAAYHVGAQYLTGRQREAYDDNDNERVLGRLGAYIWVYRRNSTLARSPHLAESKIESYEDYDGTWKSWLVDIRATKGLIPKEAAAAMIHRPGANIDHIKAAFALAPAAEAEPQPGPSGAQGRGE